MESGWDQRWLSDCKDVTYGSVTEDDVILVALEHVRGLAPDEMVGTKPIDQENLEELQRAAKSKDYVDLTQQSAEGMEQALQAPLQESDNDVARFPI